MSKTALVVIAEGSEEIEAVTVIDVLRRAEIQVTVATVEQKLQVTASRGVQLVADCLLTDCLDRLFDLIVLPGGMPGAERLRDDPNLAQLLAQQSQRRELIGAICAAPAVVLASQGLLQGRSATCYPSFKSSLSVIDKFDRPVVVEDHLITSQGPGTAMVFALTLVDQLLGRDTADRLAQSLLVAYP